MQRFRSARVRRIFLCPGDRDAAEIVRCCSQSLQRGKLRCRQSLRAFQKLRSWHWLRFSLAFFVPAHRHVLWLGRLSTPPIVAIAVDFFYRRGAADAGRYIGSQPWKFQSKKGRRKAPGLRRGGPLISPEKLPHLGIQVLYQQGGLSCCSIVVEQGRPSKSSLCDIAAQ